jgi:hypothetical protein
MGFYSEPTDSDRRDGNDRGRRELTGETESGEGGTGVNGGVTPVVRDGDGVVHNVRGFTVKLRVRSTTSNASRSDGKRRLETGRPRVSTVARFRRRRAARK